MDYMHIKNMNIVLFFTHRLEFDILERNSRIKAMNSRMVKINIDTIFEDDEDKVLALHK